MRLPRKAALFAGLSALVAAALAWLRRDAARDATQNARLKDQNHAAKINDRLSDSRADPKRLHRYHDTGWRD